MKHISILLVTLALCVTPAGRAQDAATQERLDKLSGRIDDLIASQEALTKRLDALRHEIESVRELASKPPGNWATPEDLKRVAKGVEDVDRKRREDSELVQKQLERLRKVMETPLPPPPKAKATSSPKESSVPDKPAKQQEGVEHVIKPGETMPKILKACREQNIKVTQKQILDANPRLNPDKLISGRKIFIPAVPQP
jgi:LysM repeat protein